MSQFRVLGFVYIVDLKFFVNDLHNRYKRDYCTEYEQEQTLFHMRRYDVFIAKE